MEYNFVESSLDRLGFYRKLGYFPRREYKTWKDMVIVYVRSY